MTIDPRFAADVHRMREELEVIREQRDRLLRAFGTRTIVPEAKAMTITVTPQRNRTAAPALTDAEVLQRIALADAARLRGERDDAMARMRHAARRCETTTAADALREVARIDAEIIRALEVAADLAAELRRREWAAVRLMLGGAL